MSEHTDQPRFLAHYRVTRLLGSGGMGEVFLAEDTKLDRSVALKLLPKEVAADASRRKRFLAEAKAASALNHSNVCTVYEVGETAEGQPFIAMEYLEGEPLDALARRRRLELREIVGIGVQVAEALEAARQHEVVHRDIKPGNIVVLKSKSETRNSKFQVKVVDFGLAKRLDQTGEASVMTQEGAILGTPNYLSPELALGREVDSRSDIFSLGVVLYELAAGRNPFAGASFGETVNNILNREPEPLRPWNPGVTPEFERIVRKCLEKDPNRRYSTPAQLSDDLAKIQAHVQTPRSVNRVVLAAAAAVAALAALGLGAAWLMHSRSIAPAAATTRPTSVAVLPFVNLSADKADEYLGDGVSEEIISALSKVHGLKVAARTSCFVFKGKNENIQTIGRQLHVGTVLEGSISKAGNKIRVTAQLINIADGFHLWSETYDRALDDLLGIRTDVAARVAEALKGQLLGEEKEQLARRGTENAEAYRLYLQGRYLWNRRTGESLKQAVEQFQQATRKDPAFALAYAGLADCYVLLSEYTALPPRETFPQARDTAQRALELDNTLPGPRVVLAMCLSLFEWKWEEAEAELRKVISSHPNYATARQRLAQLLEIRGKYPEALAEMRLAQEVDPVSPIIIANVGIELFLAGQETLGVESLRRQIELDPSFPPAHLHLGMIYLIQGRPDQAISELEKLRQLDPGGASSYYLGVAYGRAGKAGQAQGVLTGLQRLQDQGRDYRVGIALVQAALNDDSKAMDSLEKALEEHSTGLEWLYSDPLFKELRAHPRAQAVLRKINLLPASTAEAPMVAPPKSVAVLPFVNVSGDKADEPLSDGITDELISTLQPINGLQVKGRASSFYFRGRNERLQRIGQDLNVKYLVEGTVSRAGNKLRITVDLVTAADEAQLWATNYDRPLDDLLAIRTDVATRVAESLKGRLLGEERQQLTKRGTENAEAYRLYLQGRHLWERRTPESVKQAIEYFSQAVVKDPDYALAYSGLADCYDVLPFYWGQPRPEALKKAGAAALKALELDSSLAEPHAPLAEIRAYLDWDWPGAEAEFRQAIALSPNYATAHLWFGSMLDALGRHEEALAETRRALEIDPLSRIINATLGFQLFLTGKSDEAIQVLKKQIAFDPSFAVAHINLGWIYYLQGKFAEALAEFETMHKLDETGVLGLEGLGVAYARLGRTNDAQSLLRQMQELQRQGTDYRVGIAWVQHALGDNESALDSLEKGMTERAWGVEGLYYSPGWEDLRLHPRFQALFRKMNLVTRRSEPKSVAVLPFVNLSADKADEYLGDGITEDLCTALTQVRGLRVAARTSCFAFKGKAEDIRKIGEQLSVATVLEGSVTKADNRLRISAQLIDVSNGFHLWATNYDREMADILEMRSEIARQVVTALKVQLGVGEAERIARKPTDNPAAYALCLQGRYWSDQATSSSFTNAVKLFQQAIALDPGYALAYAGLADAFNMVSDWLLPPRTAMEAAKTNAETALRLDETLAQAHVVLSYVKDGYEYDLEGGRTECERALALAPNLAEAYTAYGFYLVRLKRFDDARKAHRRAWQLDPLSPRQCDGLALVEYYARDFPRALELSRATASQFPDSIWGHLRLAWVCEQLGRYDEAITEITRARAIDNTPDLIAREAHIYASAGQPAKALELQRQLEDLRKNLYVSPTFLAWVHLGLNQTNQAIARLQDAAEARDGFVAGLASEPYYDPLRGDPRFPELLRKIGVPW